MKVEHTPSQEEIAKTRRHMRLGALWGLGLALVIVGWVVVVVSRN